MNVTITVPLWGLVTLVISTGLPIIWGLISMYFKQQSMKEDFKVLQKDVEQQEKSITALKSEIEAKLDRHKASTDTRLMEINNTAIATKTLVELLVNDKIKK